MKKYAVFLSLLLLGVAADQLTKLYADANLASDTNLYQHYLVVEVPTPPPAGTLRELLGLEFPSNTPEEVSTIASQSTYRLNDAGEATSRARATTELVGGERFEVRQRAITLIEGFLSLRYAENPGAAWSFLADMPQSFRQPFFIGVGVIALLVLFGLLRSVAPTRRLLIIALALIAGGAVGNIIDRVAYGYVIDFIKWRPGFEWPTFNIADALIVAGVAFMFIDVLVRRRAEAKVRAAAASAQSTTSDSVAPPA